MSGQPASYAQRQLWFEHALRHQVDAGATHHSVLSVRIDEEVQVAALAAALTGLVARHEVLRTRFDLVGGELHQIVDPVREVPLPVTVVEGAGTAEREAALEPLLQESFRRPFDLETGPLLRADLFRVGAARFQLLLVMHHITTDGWSMEIVLRELSELYRAEVAGRPAKLPELPIQYRDHAARQREQLLGGAFDEDLAFWRKQLDGSANLLVLPTDRPRPAAQSFLGACREVTVPAATTRAIRALAARERVSVFVVLLSALQVTLSRWSGQDDMVIGTPSANRSASDVSGLIGYFVNLLPLRLRLDEERSFTELLGAVQGVLLDSLDHEALPFERLVEELAPERSLAHAPLIQVLYSFMERTGQGRADALGTVSDFDYAERTNLDLTFVAELAGDDLRVRAYFASDLFDAASIATLLSRYTQTLDSVLAQPGAPLLRLPIVSADDLDFLASVTRGRDEIVPGPTVLEALDVAGGVGDDHVAVVDGDRSLTYGELRERSSGWASVLRETGVGPDRVVGVCIPRSLELIVAIVAILKAGGAYLPLDPMNPPDRLAFMLADSRAGAVLTTSTGPALPGIGDLPVLRLDHDPQPAPGAHAAGPGPGPENLAYVIYTSGSTGQPKGVQLTHRGLANFTYWYRTEFGISAADRVSQLITPSADASLLDIMPTLTAGGRLVVVPEDARLTFHALWDYFARTGVTASFMITPTLRAMAPNAPAAHPSLRSLMVGGERLATAPDVLPCPLFNIYGPTEYTIAASSGLNDPGRPAHVGGPLSNTRVYVLDRWMRPVPPGVVGELYLAGPGLARGYGGRAGLTAQRFVPDVIAANGERMYRTGDQVRWQPDRTLEFLGRVDRQVKVRGFRVELEEIEQVAVTAPGIEGVVVVMHEGVPGGAGLVAFCRLSPSSSPASVSEDAWIGPLRRHIAEHLPEHMVPVGFVELDHFPLNANGKIDRRALTGMPVRRVGADPGVATPVEGPIQELVADVWQEVLGLDDVCASDNFFHLGGHSLLLAQVTARLGAVLDVRIPLSLVFERPVLSDFSEALELVLFERMDGEGRPVDA